MVDTEGGTSVDLSRTQINFNMHANVNQCPHARKCALTLIKARREKMNRLAQEMKNAETESLRDFHEYNLRTIISNILTGKCDYKKENEDTPCAVTISVVQERTSILSRWLRGTEETIRVAAQIPYFPNKGCVELLYQHTVSK